MWRISVQSVRHYWALFAGTFVALALGVALIGVSASALAATWAVDATPDGSTPSVTLKDGTGAARTLSSGDLDMGGVQSVLAMAGVVSAFVTVFVIAGTCAFGIALRRRDMGLLRLVGAGGGQVRRMVLGESLAVAVPAAVAGCAVAAVTAPLAVEALNGTGLSPSTCGRARCCGRWCSRPAAVWSSPCWACWPPRSGPRGCGRRRRCARRTWTRAR